MRFHHPLMRSAAYRVADLTERRAIHRALADATDPQSDPDRRAWHAANAAAGPDDEVAAELEASAGRAQSRGGIAAAAAFLERAAALTSNPAERGARALAAAQAKRDAAAPEAAYELLAIAELAPLSDLQRAKAALLRAQMEFARSRRAETGAPRLAEPAAQLLDAAMRLETSTTTSHGKRISRRSLLRCTPGASARQGHARMSPRRHWLRSAASPVLRPIDLLLKGMAERVGGSACAGFDDTAYRVGAHVRTGATGRRTVPALAVAGVPDTRMRRGRNMGRRAVASHGRRDGPAGPRRRCTRRTAHSARLPAQDSALCPVSSPRLQHLSKRRTRSSPRRADRPLRYHTMTLAAWRGDPAAGGRDDRKGGRGRNRQGRRTCPRCRADSSAPSSTTHWVDTRRHSPRPDRRVKTWISAPTTGR